MHSPDIVTPTSNKTIEMFRDPRAMAEHFGALTVKVMRAGLAARTAARIAAHFADRVICRLEHNDSIDEYVEELQASGLVLGRDFGVTH